MTTSNHSFPKPARILFTVPNLDTAGSKNLVFQIIQGLNRELFEPYLCVNRRGGRLEKQVLRAGIPYIVMRHTVETRPRLRAVRQLIQKARFFRRYRFALWHSFNYSDDWTEGVIARLAGVRHWIVNKTNLNWGNRSWRWRSHLADHIVSVCDAAFEKCYKGTGFERKVTVIHNGVDSQRYRPGPRNESLRRELGVPHEAVVIACVAHLVPVKGHEDLLEAFATVAKQKPDIWLALAGQGQLREKLEQQGARLGVQQNVLFLGNVADVPSLLRAADGAVLPTRETGRGEACPLALLEAMACGLPVVATDSGGPREIVESGVTGWLVPPRDPERLAQALRDLVSSPDRRAEYGAAGRKRVEGHFTLEKMIRAHEELYLKLLRDKT